MRRSRCAARTALTLLLLVPGALGAGGKSENESSAVPSSGAAPGAVVRQASVDAYWLLEEGAVNADMLLERFYLPTSLSVLRWTAYRVESQRVELSSTGGYRVVRKDPILTEPWKGAVLRGYHVRVSFTGEGDRPGAGSTTRVVAFAYDPQRPPAKGAAGFAPQPLQQALLEGIEAGGKKTGSARVLALEYRGNGRFEARVELQ
jgi:hypothetical protein